MPLDRLKGTLGKAMSPLDETECGRLEAVVQFANDL